MSISAVIPSLFSCFSSFPFRAHSQSASLNICALIILFARCVVHHPKAWGAQILASFRFVWLAEILCLAVFAFIFTNACGLVNEFWY